jgi:hypothetical protein
MTEAAASGASASTTSDVQTASGKRVHIPQKQQAAPPEQAQTQAPAQPETPWWETLKGKKLPVKIDGNEEEVDFDELRSGYQKARASKERFEKAQRMAQDAYQRQQEASKIQQALETGNFEFVESKLGRDRTVKLFEDYLIKQMEYESLSPAEKTAMAEKRRADQLAAQIEKIKADDERKRFEAESAKAQQEIDTEVSQALQKLGRKPTPRLVLRIADEMIARLQGQQPVTAEIASQAAMQGIYQDIGEYLPQLDDETLLKVIPKEVQDRLRKYEVSRVMGEKSQVRVKPQNTREPPKKFGIEEKFKEIEKRFMR